MTEDLAFFPLWYVAFLFSLVCHEAAHALVALWGGDTTAYEGGQVSLDPIPHIRQEPFGTVVVPIASFLLGGFMIGWASAPYDPRWQRAYPHRAAWMALAGPVANFLLAFIAAVAMILGVWFGLFSDPFSMFESKNFSMEFPFLFGNFLMILYILNVFLGTFNLLPIPPLDGNTAIGLLLPEDWALKFAELSHQPIFSIIGLIVAWNLLGEIVPVVIGGAFALLAQGMMLL